MRFFILLLFFSGSVFADTYPVVSVWSSFWYPGLVDSTQSGLCSKMNTAANLTPPSQLIIYNGYCVRTDGPGLYSSPYPTSLDSSCPSGGTVSGTSCINAPSCTAPQVRNSTSGVCQTPVVVCPAGQFSFNAGPCTLIPNCNLSSPADGNFFNTATNSCAHVDSDACASPPSGYAATYFCPAVNDCKKADFICSDKSTAQTDAERAAAVAAAKTAADADKARADQATASAAAASAAKAAAKTAADQAAAAAKTASDQAAASSAASAAEKAAAAKSYSDAATSALNATAKAVNSAAAAVVSAVEAAIASAADALVPSSNPGDAATRAEQVRQAASKAIVARDDAVSGEGTGTGAQQGTAAGTCTQTGTCTDGLAKESTVGAIKDVLTKTGTDISTIQSGEFSDETGSLIESKKTELTVEYSRIKNDIKNTLNMTLSSGGSALPVIPYGTIKGVEVSADVGRFSSSFELLGVVVYVLACLLALSIVLG